MKRYPRVELERIIADCMLFGCIPLRIHEWLKALVDQANAAFEAERRAERAETALGQLYAEGVR